MADLLTLDELRIWTREPIDQSEDIAFAEVVIAAASLRIAEEVSFASWLDDADSKALAVAKGVAVKVARRAYLNPDQETRSAAIGPIGGASYIDEFASGLELTKIEQERLEAAADLEDTSTSAGFFTISLTREDMGRPSPVVLNDSAGSGIMYAHPDEAGGFTP